MSRVLSFEAYRPIANDCSRNLSTVTEKVGRLVCSELQKKHMQATYVSFNDEHAKHVHIISDENISEANMKAFARDNSAESVRLALSHMYLTRSAGTMRARPFDYFVDAQKDTAYFGVSFKPEGELREEVNKGAVYLLNSVRGTPILTPARVITGAFTGIDTGAVAAIRNMVSGRLRSELPMYVALGQTDVLLNQAA